MPRRKKTLDEVAARRGLEATEYIQQIIDTEWKGALREALRHIARKAKEGDDKANYYITDHFLAKVSGVDPGDARAASVLKGIARIRSREPKTDGDVDEAQSGDWADDSDEEGEAIHLEPLEPSEAEGAALSTVADVREGPLF